MRDAQLIRQLGAEITRVLAPFAPPGSTYALLDFPSYANVGDSAIWLGAWKCLTALTGRPPVHCCDWKRYDPNLLRRQLGDGTIFLSGGGNFGDLWESLQRFRERVVEDFPDNPIVLLPQSIHFEQRENLDRARAVAFGLEPARQEVGSVDPRGQFREQAEVLPGIVHRADQEEDRIGRCRGLGVTLRVAGVDEHRVSAPNGHQARRVHVFHETGIGGIDEARLLRVGRYDQDVHAEVPEGVTESLPLSHGRAAVDVTPRPPARASMGVGASLYAEV